MSSMFQVMTTSKKAKEGKTQVHPVKLTLEELYHGCLKKVVFQRKKLAADDNVETEERELVIDVRPGLPDGTRFVFEGSAPAFTTSPLLPVTLTELEAAGMSAGKGMLCLGNVQELWFLCWRPCRMLCTSAKVLMFCTRPQYPYTMLYKDRESRCSF